MIGDEPVVSGIELAPGVSAAPEVLRWQFSRSGGPGGQNVNKLNTRAELWIALEALRGLNERAAARLKNIAGRQFTAASEIHIVAAATRTQEGNRQAALDRLREMIVLALHEPKPRRRTRPTAASRRRRLEGKRHRSEIKERRRGSIGE